MDALVAQMANMPAVARKIKDEHQETPNGRCGICRAAPQGGFVPFPCNLYSVADSALKAIAERRRTGGRTVVADAGR